MSSAGIIAVNQMSVADAMKVFGRCCGSSAWAMQMARGRPYQDLGEMLRFADLKFRSMTRKDWLEAFIHVPDIGDIVTKHREGLPAGAIVGRSGQELTRLVDRLDRQLNRYQRKFGHKFIPFDEDAGLETLIGEIMARCRNRPPDEMEMICNNRRKFSLRFLASMMENYRPQEGDGVAIDSKVTGETLSGKPERDAAAAPSAAKSATRNRLDS